MTKCSVCGEQKPMPIEFPPDNVYWFKLAEVIEGEKYYTYSEEQDIGDDPTAICASCFIKRNENETL